jgi:phosphatidylglycerophosphate synthase
MSFRKALEQCRSGLVPEHYLYFRVLSPTAGVGLAAAALVVGIRPNGVTIAGLTMAVPIVAFNLSGHLLWACFLLHFFYGIDCADGILARATGQTSRAGAFLDDLAHSVVPPAFFLSLAIWAISQSLQSLAIVAASYTSIELAYRNVVQVFKDLPLIKSRDERTSGRGSRYRGWVLSSFHLPTVSVFVTAVAHWLTLLTLYLAYASLGTALYCAYVAFTLATRMDRSA